MSENETTPEHAPVRGPRTAIFRVVAGILVGAEGVVLIGAAVWLLISLFAAPALSVVSAVALLVLVVICAIGVCAMAVGIFRGQRWARSGGIVVQVLFLAIAGGAATDQFGDVSLGLKIGIPALITFAILIAEVRSVGRADAAEEAAAAAEVAAVAAAAAAAEDARRAKKRGSGTKG